MKMVTVFEPFNSLEFGATVYGKVCICVLLNDFAALFYIHSCYKISKCFAGGIRIFELFTQMVQ